MQKRRLDAAVRADMKEDHEVDSDNDTEVSTYQRDKSAKRAYRRRGPVVAPLRPTRDSGSIITEENKACRITSIPEMLKNASMRLSASRTH